MENLNAEQVKKALECCGSKHYSDEKYECKNCPLNGRSFDEGSCYDEVLHDNALALIISQEQRIKELAEENKKLTINMNAYGLTAKRLGEENERLKNRITCQVVLPDEKLEEIKNECLERFELDIKAIQVDAVRKMQERLHERFGADANRVYSNYNIHRYIDQIAKEMLEGEDEG